MILTSGLLFCLVPGLFQPAPPSLEQRLERAAICLRVQRLDCAQAELSQVDAGLARLAPPLRMQALVLGAELALTRQKEVEPALARLLTADPDWTPQNAWPTAWRAALDTAKTQRRRQLDRTGPRIEVEPITAVAGAPIDITAQTYDPAGVAAVQLRWGPTLNDHAAMRPVDQNRTLWAARLDPIDAATRRIAIEAKDSIGNASLWGPEALAVHAAAPDPAFYETWWFWTAAGVVVAGVTTAVLWPAPEQTVTRIDFAEDR